MRVGAYLTTRASTVSRVVPATSLTMDLSVPEDEKDKRMKRNGKRWMEVRGRCVYVCVSVFVCVLVCVCVCVCLCACVCEVGRRM